MSESLLRTSSARRSTTLSPPQNAVRRVSVRLEADGDEPAETIHFTLGDPINDESTKFGPLRNKCGKFVNNTTVQIIMVSVIVANAALLGVMTVKSIQDNDSVFNALNWLDRAFLISFTVEFILQFIYLGPKFLRHSWLIFDCFIIIFSWAFIGSSASVLRSFRIFRVFSLVSKWKSMQDLVSAVGKTLPRLTSIFICLLLIFYVYAVLCTSLYIDLYDQGHLNYPYFERLDYTFITLFQFMTLDSWHGVVRQVQEVKPWSWLCFYSFAILTAFVVLNLIVAVVCEAVVELNAGKAREKSEEQSRIMIESAPVDEMVGQQADLQKAQMELERTLELIMKRIPQAS